MAEAADQSRTIVVASDHAGLGLKLEIVSALREQNWAVEDLGTNDTQSCDYPDFAHRLAQEIESGRQQRGILICGSGIGMSIAANRHPGVRAALCTDPYAARMSREHNDANVLCLGARIVGGGLALDIVAAFLAGEFAGGRHARRVDKITPG